MWLIHRRIGRHLDRRRRLAAEHRAAPGREDQHIGSARDDAGHAHGIVAGRVHHDEALGLDRLRVVNHVHHRRAAALGDGAERFFVDRRQAAFLVAGRWIVVDLGAEDAGVPLPPLDALDQFLADFLADRRAGSADVRRHRSPGFRR